MDLRDNNNDMYGNDYQSRPNPNDALFGGMGGSEPYHVTSTYTGSSYNKKGNGGSIIIMVVAILIVAAVAVFAIKNIKGNSKYDGYYELTKASYMGMTMEVDQLETMSGMTMEANIEIKGKYADMVINNNGDVKSGRCKITIEGSSVTLVDGSDTLYGTYDEETQTITVQTTGADLIFEKVE